MVPLVTRSNVTSQRTQPDPTFPRWAVALVAPTSLRQPMDACAWAVAIPASSTTTTGLHTTHLVRMSEDVLRNYGEGQVSCSERMKRPETRADSCYLRVVVTDRAPLASWPGAVYEPRCPKMSSGVAQDVRRCPGQHAP